MGLNIFGLIHPEFRPQDRAVQTATIFVLAVLVGLSFPTVRLWVIEVALICLTGVVELAQLFGIMVGAAQVADLLSDIFGTLAAVLLVGFIRASGHN